MTAISGHQEIGRTYGRFRLLFCGSTDRGQPRKDGQKGWKGRIDNAIASGSTSGEILMAVRWQLRESVKAWPDMSSEIKGKALELVERINQVLPEK